MIDIAKVDISEDEIMEFDEELLEILLSDRTTGKKILWATDDYKDKGYGFAKTDHITVDSITGEQFSAIIRPRSVKSIEQQKARARSKAEVFTPSWLCNKQNNLLDESFFGRGNVFNIEEKMDWITLYEKIAFPEGKDWKDYVLNPVLEISCGEAPYLVSRYDTTSGVAIDPENRIGLLDRKFRIIAENTTTYEEWLEWSIKAVEHTYGFELQGDNLLIARENILFTYLDYYYQRNNKIPNIELVRRIAYIISWNLWQMDGLKLVIPFSCNDTVVVEQPISSAYSDDSFMVEKVMPCPGCLKNDKHGHNGLYCKFKDWDTGSVDLFVNIVKKYP